MKLFATALLLCAMAIGHVVARPLQLTPQFPKPDFGNPVAHASTHEIRMANVAFGAGCSATAIGPHAILTAAHCSIGTNDVKIVDMKVVGKLAELPLYDNNDHMILIFSNVTFDHYAALDQRVPTPGEIVYMWGNPGSSADVYRIGYVKGREDYVGSDEITRTLYALQLGVFAGDSGSGIFDAAGKVLTVTSMGDESANSFDFILAFTQDQLKEAAK